MLDATQSLYLRVIQDVFGEKIPLDTAVTLTYILNRYLIYIHEDCLQSQPEDVAIATEMTLRYASEIICKLDIDISEKGINDIWWRGIWGKRYREIYLTKEFHNLTEHVISLLAAHPCVDKIIED